MKAKFRVVRAVTSVTTPRCESLFHGKVAKAFRNWVGNLSLLQAFACGVGLLCCLPASAEENAVEPIESPHANGGVVSIVETESCRRYVHVFTNTAKVVQFRNRSRQALRGRILVVGAGGAGGYGLNTASGGGGGGGGGGVWEQKGFVIPSGSCWDVLVGKGATKTTNVNSSRNDTAGSSSISNGTECIALVPGGGNGGESIDVTNVENGHGATSGAAGGGGIRALRSGAEGTYASSIYGVVYGPFSGGDGTLYRGGGGGGAGAAGASENGGEGLASDITGVSLVYGSGGGGGGSITSSAVPYSNGTGGTRAGNGAFATVENSSTNVIDATAPVANSGGGGAGGLGGQVTDTSINKGSARYGSSGADGIVIIAYEFYKIPFVGGEVTKIAERGDTSTYIHVFTNVSEVATFENVTGQDVPVRTLVVGAGGAGGYGLNSASGGGGGGGGGGVLDVANITMSADSVWNVLVGKGAIRTTNVYSSRNDTAGASSISNGTECIALVPGGGNGGESTSSATIENGHEATSGAAGGGGIRALVARDGAEGTYASSIYGVAYGPFSGGDGTLYRGGGGGGAGAAGSGENGGEGLSSDITGVSLVYGSGGGGGGSITSEAVLYSNGTGGTRAGTGAFATVEDSSTNVIDATAPVANSGGGGAGGLGGSFSSKGSARYGSSGANGIVVIRYDWTFNSNPRVSGFKVIVR